MEKEKFQVLIRVLILVLVVLCLKVIVQLRKIDTSAQEKVNIEVQYEKFKVSNKPSIIIFSYNADCCPSTKKFFDEYNSKAKRLMSEYEDEINMLFINTGTLKDKDEEVVQNIAEENGVSNIPWILLMDSSGKPYKVIEGRFDEGEVRKIIDGMVE